MNPAFGAFAGQQAPMRLPTQLKRSYEGSLWSTYRYTDGQAVAGTNTNLFFSTPLGGQGQGHAAALSISETNIAEASRIPTGVAFTVRALAFEIKYDDAWEPTRADVRNFQYSSVLSWKFPNTEIDVAPVQLVGEGGGIFGAGTADTGALEGVGGSRIAFANGLGQTWVYDSLAIILPASQQFNVRQSWGANAIAIDGGRNDSNIYARLSLLGMISTAIPVG
jgi:hypothetical protein